MMSMYGYNEFFNDLVYKFYIICYFGNIFGFDIY